MFKDFTKTTAYSLLLYGILFIPFPFYIFSFQAEISQFLFGDLIKEILKGWGIEITNSEITSDSINLYVLILLLLILSSFTSIILLFIKKWEDYQNEIFNLLKVLFTFYLSMQLLKYGCDKLFKSQFYLPEPNTLYTPLGQISKDLLFWSTMGSSYSYNIFMGMLEVIPAIFLLFKKTRIIGLLLVIPVLINIVSINFSFDISVKVYSLFLLSLSLFLLLPFLTKLYDFFIQEKMVRLKIRQEIFSQKSFLRTSLKTFVFGLIFIEALFPYLSKWNFNDDQISRPYLHGAYEIEAVYKNDQIISEDELSIKRIFIHRRGYLIFQNEQDEMQDFKLEIDTIKRQFILTNYQQKHKVLDYRYHEKESLIDLQYFKNDELYSLTFRTLDWNSLPLLQNDFHWFVEDVK